ncbi:hypothetical protein [Mucilaginibacter gynuensis]|uniref:hypothetical protein n=1 Tax=Mucilaginibacter gynuensis TaxID=1302236 RepID=UPI0031E64A83
MICNCYFATAKSMPDGEVHAIPGTPPRLSPFSDRLPLKPSGVTVSLAYTARLEDSRVFKEAGFKYPHPAVL